MKMALCLNHRFSLLFVRFVALTALLFFVLLPFGQLSGTERDEYRSDVLTFHGDKKISADSLSSDSFFITLDCKTTAPQTPPRYSFILRGIDPVERALLQDVQSDGKWDRFDLFRAAMIVEGVRDPELIRTYDARLDALVAKVLSGLRAKGENSPRILARTLFEAMHKEILTQPYSLDCTELSKVMKTGHFNCVSATVLFNCLAEKAGLNVCALEMPGHALSRIKFADGITMNLETTCPTYFDLQSEKDRERATLQRVAPITAPTNPRTAQNAGAPPEVVSDTELPSDLREISPVQLTATIYYNIGVDLHAKKRYPEAAAANIKALYLDKGNEQAWTNLLASINNWVLDLVADKENGRYDIAAILLDEGVKLDPTYSNFRSNQTFVFYYWIHTLAGKGNFDTAQKVFEHAEKRIPNDKDLQNLISAINDINQAKKKRESNN